MHPRGPRDPRRAARGRHVALPLQPVAARQLGRKHQEGRPVRGRERALLEPELHLGDDLRHPRRYGRNARDTPRRAREGRRGSRRRLATPVPEGRNARSVAPRVRLRIQEPGRRAQLDLRQTERAGHPVALHRAAHRRDARGLRPRQDPGGRLSPEPAGRPRALGGLAACEPDLEERAPLARFRQLSREVARPAALPAHPANPGRQLHGVRAHPRDPAAAAEAANLLQLPERRQRPLHDRRRREDVRLGRARDAAVRARAVACLLGPAVHDVHARLGPRHGPRRRSLRAGRARLLLVRHPRQGPLAADRREGAARLLRRRFGHHGLLERPPDEGARLPHRSGPRRDLPAGDRAHGGPHRLALEAHRLRVEERQVLGDRLLRSHQARHPRPLLPYADREAGACRALPLLRHQPLRRGGRRTDRLDRQRDDDH